MSVEEVFLGLSLGSGVILGAILTLFLPWWGVALAGAIYVLPQIYRLIRLGRS